MTVATERLGRSVFCKYSVRDVAFVNLDGSNWQLIIQKPDSADDAAIDGWNKEIRDSLDRVNLSVRWVEHHSDRFRGTETAVANKLNIVLIDADGNTIRPEPIDANAIENSINRLVRSAKRDQILEKNVKALCVYVLIESGDRAKDAAAHVLVAEAIDETTGQLWSLEKPTQQGPGLVTVTVDDRAAEAMLIEMLGVKNFEEPSVAVVYGQARRMGDVLSGKTLLKKNLVWMAGVCGRDCECSLNRDWLYGTQLLHRWDKAKERAVEDILGFDPHSALVVSEVAQILQKTARSKGSEVPDMNDGFGGLVIHDLEDLSQPKNDQQQNTDQHRAKAGDVNAESSQNSGATTANDASNQPTNNDKSKSQQQDSNENRVQVKGTDRPVDPDSSQETNATIPWTLLIAVAVVSSAIVFWKLAGK